MSFNSITTVSFNVTGTFQTGEVILKWYEAKNNPGTLTWTLGESRAVLWWGRVLSEGSFEMSRCQFDTYVYWPPWTFD